MANHPKKPKRQRARARAPFDPRTAIWGPWRRSVRAAERLCSASDQVLIEIRDELRAIRKLIDVTPPQVAALDRMGRGDD